ncbi:hypothetical protein SPRG_06928 [Saprolegnia parasitica CBS 223.65]|uniref:Disease resistance R13L4/SHOC-2-like LRR domain-containing protein n=1 Tax=Saprolegnia parasitica (strain CBS 223.65) TaxID=695850 RepID=A0A067CLI7_SAPPC|nr:hypothetical protein SPRG_06928 [Saprolegnia parasitica CBS 223.65]KDO27657.1 hypothetical protein SPRG_06928 [Saprolegnia parasitica CBS 223.65]|eukprot:XP_012201778.1 hypothetical protein SPRG_06928 [Saprolegnia parasitica CBS 223.65]
MGGGTSKEAAAPKQAAAASTIEPKAGGNALPKPPKPIKDLKLYISMFKDDALELSHASGSDFTGTLTTHKLAVLKQVPPEIFVLCHLKELNVSANDIHVLDPAIANLEALTKLDLSQNHLSELPDALCQLPNLSSLIVSENDLVALPKTIGNLKALTQIIAFKNGITTLPDSIDGCIALEEINFYNNKLTELGPGFFKLANLVELNIAGNALTQLGAIPNLVRLKRCAAYFNRLRTFPDLNHCKELTQVQLYRNQLKELPDLSNLPSLTEVDVNTNLLRQIPESLCTGNTSMRMLNLRKNRLVELPACIGQLTALEILNLGGNAISSPVPDSIAQLPALVSFLFDDSNLTVLPLALLGLHSLVRVDVGRRIDKSDATTIKVMAQLEAICVANRGWLKQT